MLSKYELSIALSLNMALFKIFKSNSLNIDKSDSIGFQK